VPKGDGAPRPSTNRAFHGAKIRNVKGLLPHLLVVSALVLPFEAPLFHAGPLLITSVELALYATIAAWGLDRVRDAALRPSECAAALRATLRDPVVAAAVAGWGVSMASALTAPAYRAESAKFALRAASGLFVFLAARSVSGVERVARRVVLALVAGACLSALTGIVDAWWPGSAPLWRAFRDQSFDTFGLPRASGVFAYPTMAAMYWEAAVALCIVAPFLRRPTGRAWAPTTVALLGSSLLLAAIAATATRSGFVGALAGCLALAAGRILDAAVRRGAATALGVFAASCAIAFWVTGPDSLLGQRMRWWRDGHWFGAEYSVGPAPRTVRVGSVFTVPVTVRNTGALTWPHGGERPVHLGSHWEALGRVSVLGDFEGARTELAADVPPGGEANLVATVQGPSAPGDYVLRWDLVQEHTTWFSERGNDMPSQPVKVEGGALTVAPHAGSPVPPLPPTPASRPQLWRAAVRLWSAHPLLGIGPDNFRRSYQRVVPPGPNGQRYTDVRLHANSLYFETLADTGLAGLAALVLLMVVLAARVRTHFRVGDLARTGAGVALGTFFVHGVTDYFFEFTPLIGLFWLLAGLTAPAQDARRPTEP
jgi:hypothetical protein